MAIALPPSSSPHQSTMVTLADETTEDDEDAEDLIDLTSAKQQRHLEQHSNPFRLQHSPKVTFFDGGNDDASNATRGEEETNDDETDHI